MIPIIFEVLVLIKSTTILLLGDIFIIFIWNSPNWCSLTKLITTLNCRSSTILFTSPNEILWEGDDFLRLLASHSFLENHCSFLQWSRIPPAAKCRQEVTLLKAALFEIYSWFSLVCLTEKGQLDVFIASKSQNRHQSFLMSGHNIRKDDQMLIFTWHSVNTTCTQGVSNNHINYGQHEQIITQCSFTW